MPAKAGIQYFRRTLDSRLRGNDADRGPSHKHRRRLFFALWPDDAVRAAMARAASAIYRAHDLVGRLIPDERLHLTLVFLGDIAPEVEARLLAGAAGLSGHAFDLRLEQAGCFHRSRVFWLGARGAPARLIALWQSLCDVSAMAGLEPDHRPLAPHVTCGRDIRGRILSQPIEPIVWPVRSFALVHSELGAHPQYHVVSHWPLQTDAATPVKTVQAPGGP